MADRYWVGGSGTWDSSTTTNWSSSSGGAGGASAPTTSDIARFDANSDTGSGVAVTLGTGWACGGLIVTAPDQTITWSGTAAGTVGGTFSLSATNSVWSGTGQITLSGTGSFDFNPNGVTINGAIVFNDTGGTWTQQSALMMGSNDNVTVTGGALNTAGYAITAQNIIITGTTTRSISLGASTLTTTGTGNAWNASNVTNLTWDAGTSNIVMSRNTNAKTFVGGGLTYATVTQGGTGALTITGSNTFGTLTTSVTNVTVTFTAGTTQTIGTWGLNGTSGNPIVLNSTAGGSAWTVSKGSGTVTADYVTLSDSTATGGATWNATNSTDGGGNTGWNFGGAAVEDGGFFMFMAA